MKQTDVHIDFAIEIDVANSEIIRPMSGSSAHPAAGRSISRVQSTQGCGKKILCNQGGVGTSTN